MFASGILVLPPLGENSPDLDQDLDPDLDPGPDLCPIQGLDPGPEVVAGWLLIWFPFC